LARSDTHAVTALLHAWTDGDLQARDRLFSHVYTDLRRRAARYLRQERPDHSLHPPDLVHEAYLRLTDQQRVDWQNRSQFFGIASQMMRRILVDARARVTRRNAPVRFSASASTRESHNPIRVAATCSRSIAHCAN
jgi:RNA polymerase sigma factor (TIGR02999 family)